MVKHEISQDLAPTLDVDHRAGELDLQHDEHRVAQMMSVWRYTPQAARYELDTRRHRPWRGYSSDASARIATAAEMVGRGVPGGEAAGDHQ